MKKLVVSSIVFIFVVGIAGLLIFFLNKPFGISTSSSSETALVQEKLVEISELATLKFEYSNVIVSRTNKNISLPVVTDIKFAEAIRLIQYTGYLKAGSDLSEIEISIDETAEQISVRVPKAKILDNVAETEKTKVEDVKGNIFSDYPTQTVFDEINKEKKRFEEEKIEQGLLGEADKKTEEVLTSILSSDGYKDIVIEFY
ncbi:DUF4230 domain-containing protein [Planococcus glaciei]|uniref:DUF4230 domain-containing protein n=1 Tax=Planococcus glaciei TaxID=459472 RepID=UPI001C73C0A0|nr:DUF4230 domain-containing protein [Planococcus glaciei]MBX0315323.1 DUF4230 domain-containing protein [Planococcus glaciei]